MKSTKNGLFGEESFISGIQAFRVISLSSLVLAILTGLLPTIVYIREGYDFSLFTTYLSDIGATPIWPQTLFNTGTLLAAPLRLLVVILLAFQLNHFGVNKRTCIALIVISFISTIGTIFMTAVPYTVNLTIHKTGIGLYFLGIVFLQSLIGVAEWRIPRLSRILPILSWMMVVIFFIFVGFVFAFENGSVSRSVPVIWEWMSYFSSLTWLATHYYFLGTPACSARDRLAEFGLTEFCDVCMKCARRCPSQAISYGGHTFEGPTVSNNPGSLKWYLDAEKCMRFWIELGEDCSNCLRACPFNKPPGILHDVVRAIINNTSLFNRLFVRLDDALGYGEKGTSNAFFDYE